MADGLKFGINFDLDEGIKKAIAEGPKGLKKLEDALARHPVTIKLKLDEGRTRSAKSEIVGFKKQLLELTREWNTLTAAERGGVQGAALRERYRSLQREAQGYVSTLNAAVKQEDKLTAAANRAATATNKLTKEFKIQDGYVSRLIKRLIVYASYQQLTNFLTSVRKVTAQFELQRVSLGAIIQDQAKANALFAFMNQLLRQILLGSTNNLCNRKEKLRADNSGDYPHYDEGEAICSCIECNAIGCARTIYSSDSTNKTANTDKGDDKSYNNGDVAEYIEELGRAVEFLKKVTHAVGCSCLQN